MAIRRLSSASAITGAKSSKVWDQETFPGDFVAIATAVVDSSGASTITFSNIPSTYKHLQIRGVFTATGTDQNVLVQVGNSTIDTGTNYSGHILINNNGSVVASNSSNASEMNFLGVWYGANANSLFIIDALDYTNTNKYKTFRSLFGNDNNSAGQIGFGSGLWRSQSAIDTITIKASSIRSFNQYSQFALYGQRG